MIPRLLLAVGVVVLFAPGLGAHTDDEAPIDVVEVSGVIDGLGADFIVDAIAQAAEEGAQAVVLQVDSAGAADPGIAEAVVAVEGASIPVIAWIGPAPATARGGALELAQAAHLTLAAPGSTIGFSSPMVLGHGGSGSTNVTQLETVQAPGGIIDGVEPALGPLIAGLDGTTIDVGGRAIALATAEQVTLDDGSVRSQVAPEVRFQEPGLLAKLFRLALRPEAIFFFLTAGLTFAAFEFYAIGPGLAAATAALPLLLAGYGLVTLPIGWGLVAVLAALAMLVADYQRGGFGAVSYAASVVLFVGGLYIVDSRPQLPPSLGSIAVVTIGVILFFMFAMPTVARARFTTQTMGRDYLIGRHGTAVSPAEDGALTVDVDGSRWRATTFRESAIEAGTAVRVESVQGLYLEVVEADPGLFREN